MISALPQRTSFARTEAEQSIVSRFEEQVALRPNKLAVSTTRYQFTYEQLNKLANQIARAVITGTSVAKGAVALLFDHDALVIAGMLGVLKAGKFYVVLHSSHPVERLHNIVVDAEAELLLTESKHLGLAREISSNDASILQIDDLESGLDEANVDANVAPTDLACLIYTSGSTGRPKGVCQTHRNILHYIGNYTSACELSATDRFSLLASCSYSASTANIFGALLNGGALFPFDLKQEGIHNLPGWLRDNAITIYHSVPLVFRSLTQAINNETFPELRLVKLGGEAIARSDFELFKKYFAQDARLYVGLGCSEVNFVRCWLLNHSTKVDEAVVPVGYAPEGTEVLLLDEKQREVADGEVGEIAIRSNYLFPGYWRRPDLNKSVFMKDPGGSSLPVFRTGDLGRMLHGGLLQHLGRNSFQVKIRGSRVEPGEIEAALRSQPVVRDAVVVANGANENKLLVAYLTSENGNKPDATTLRSRLAATLPDYMLPARYIWVSKFPLTNGKIDRLALCGANQDARSREYLAPRNDLERQLVKVWEKILQHERIGVRDSFFELGGHSLLAAQIAIEIEKVIGEKLPLTTLFWAPTVEALARHLTSNESTVSSIVELKQAGRGTPLFIVHGWGGDVHFYGELARLLPDQPVYGIQAIGLDGKVARHTSVEEMASYYLRELRAFQPSGPYYLLGYSLGCTIAFELAQQLCKSGQHVAFLGLLDPPIRSAPWFVYGRTIAPLLIQSGRHHLRRWRATGESLHLRRRWKRLRRWLKKNRAHSPVVTTMPACSSERPEIPGYRDYYSAVAASYRLRRYRGALDLIVSDSLPRPLSPLWGHLAKDGATIRRITCTHRQMIEKEHLPEVARLLTDALAMRKRSK